MLLHYALKYMAHFWLTAANCPVCSATLCSYNNYANNNNNNNNSDNNHITQKLKCSDNDAVYTIERQHTLKMYAINILPKSSPTTLACADNTVKPFSLAALLYTKVSLLFK